MADVVKYILDANIFIEASRRYYAFDLCRGFWDSLVHHNCMGHIESIDRVKDELSEGDDLDTWKKTSPTLFASTNSKDVLTAYTDVMQWVHSQERFTPAAKSEFSRGADAWVIAYAKANNAFVVTHEKLELESKKNVKIPDACKPFNVECKNTWEMLRELEIQFHWNPS